VVCRAGLRAALEEVPAHADGAEQGQGGVTVSGNGDVNGDNGLDLSDAIYLLTHLFQGGPAPLACPSGGGDCPQCEADLATCQQALAACNPDPEDCNDGEDNDGDCDIDCDDSDCDADPNCEVVTPGFTFIGTNPTTGLDEYREDETLIEFVLLPGGTFDMGSPDTEPNRTFDEGPVHAVTLDPFLISKTEVTQDQYAAVTGLIPSEFSGDGQRPVERVSWNDLKEAGGFLQKTGLRLPTEAEWEYAARGGTSTAYSFGDDCNADTCIPCVIADNFMWWCANAPFAQPVSEKAPNGFGLFDMHGNVWEWCRDWSGAYTLPVSPGDGERQVGPTPTTEKIRRGGTVDSALRADGCRSASRSDWPPGVGGRAGDMGFRVAAPAPPP
jgi:formylglycine-generating enzyme required for sulfatase activity